MSSQLRDDISSEYQVNQLIRAVENFMSGRTDKWNATGNAWTVVIGPGGAIFEYAIADGSPGRAGKFTHLSSRPRGLEVISY